MMVVMVMMMAVCVVMTMMLGRFLVVVDVLHPLLVVAVYDTLWPDLVCQDSGHTNTR